MFQVDVGGQEYSVHFEHYPPQGGMIAGATFCYITALNEESKKVIGYGSCVLKKRDWSTLSKNGRRKQALKQALDWGDFDGKRRKLFWDAYHAARGYVGKAKVILPMTDKTLDRLRFLADWEGHTKAYAMRQLIDQTYEDLGNGKRVKLVFRKLARIIR